MQSQLPQKKMLPTPTINIWATVSELGFIIAIPLVLLVVLAVKVDRYFNTTPLFIIIAILASPALSGIAIWRKIKSLNQYN